MACRPGYVDTDESELNYFESSCHEAGRLTNFGDLPLLVISRDPDLRTPDMSERLTAQQPVWDREQEALKSLSSRSWRVVARSSGHMVPIDKPDVILREMNILIEYIRGGPPPPFESTMRD
jgi:hypothetical protein